MYLIYMKKQSFILGTHFSIYHHWLDRQDCLAKIFYSGSHDKISITRQSQECRRPNSRQPQYIDTTENRRTKWCMPNFASRRHDDATMLKIPYGCLATTPDDPRFSQILCHVNNKNIQYGETKLHRPKRISYIVAQIYIIKLCFETFSKVNC